VFPGAGVAAIPAKGSIIIWFVPANNAAYLICCVRWLGLIKLFNCFIRAFVSLGTIYTRMGQFGTILGTELVQSFTGINSVKKCFITV
jgi:hypothetical protein